MQRINRWAEDADLNQIAQTTAGFTGADLENLLNEAAINAAKENRSYIIQKDIEKAFMKVGVGAEKKSRLFPRKKRRLPHIMNRVMRFYSMYFRMWDRFTVSIIPTGGGSRLYDAAAGADEMFEYEGKNAAADIMVSWVDEWQKS